MLMRTMLLIAVVGTAASPALAGGNVKAVRQPAQSVASTTQSNNQLETIQMQSLMNQRQTALQMTTNLLNTTNAGARRVARNIGK